MNEKLNEYDFVLYHLYKHSDEYAGYYQCLRKLKPNRLMILDNSAYEFFVSGEKLDLYDYVYTIDMLEPDLFILPDTLMDSKKTREGSLDLWNRLHNDNWNSQLEKYKRRAMGVIQGNSEEELLGMMQFYKQLGVRNVAIPFHLSFYKEYGGSFYKEILREMTSSCNDQMIEDARYAAGRIEFVRKWGHLLKPNFGHVHLLGSHNPIEKIYHSSVIDTFDTGYPVKCAMEGYELGAEPHKPDSIIDDFMHHELDEETKTLLINNVDLFRSW